MLALASVVAVLAVAVAAGVLWMRGRRGSRPRDEDIPAGAPFDMGGDYLEEIRANLARLDPLERSTLRHLHREGMQTFTAERDSAVLRRLVRRGLLHAMGSDAYPADAYPFRVPSPVWSELSRRDALPPPRG